MTKLFGEITRSSERDGENSQVIILITPEQVCRDYPNTKLSELIGYWQEPTSTEGAVPSIENFRPPFTALPWINVSPENPMYIAMNNHPAGLCGDWNATRLAKYPVVMRATSCVFKYYDCREQKVPRYIHIRQIFLA